MTPVTHSADKGDTANPFQFPEEEEDEEVNKLGHTASFVESKSARL